MPHASTVQVWLNGVEAELVQRDGQAELTLKLRRYRVLDTIGSLSKNAYFYRCSPCALSCGTQ